MEQPQEETDGPVPPALVLENENQASDLYFHPTRDVLVAGLVDGSAKVYVTHYSLRSSR